jgi:hypothetical protein
VRLMSRDDQGAAEIGARSERRIKSICIKQCQREGGFGTTGIECLTLGHFGWSG